MNEDKPNLLVSFSGGETSGYMTQLLLNHWKDVYNMVVVFANTGEEREETLEFVNKCDKILEFSTVWVESKVHHNERKGSTHRVVDFKTASRNGEPFEEVIKKYGIPNQKFPHCTRELKTNPITSFVKNDLGWDNFYTAIGIRVDEIDRIHPDFEEKKYLYPLAQNFRSTRQHVNKYWSQMPFRLELKSWEGNCKVCWKKSFRKLYTIAKDNPKMYKNFKKWEDKYEDYETGTRNKRNPPYRFFRGNKSVNEIIEESSSGMFHKPIDESKETQYQKDIFDEFLDVGSGCEESCEPF